MKDLFKGSNVAVSQEQSGWCGPAVIQMVLKAAGIDNQQKEIANKVYLRWWGTTQDAMIAYLSQYFKEMGSSQNLGIKEAKKHLSLGRIVVVDWWNDLDGSDEPDGHYSVLLFISPDNILTLADPSCDGGFRKIAAKDFIRRWYDYKDFNCNIKSQRWLLWVNPKSLATFFKTRQ